MDHDHSYKLLFAHPKMMRDLLEGFVVSEWVSEADFSTLERVNENHITEGLRSRVGDLIWRIRCGEHVVYLLLEFQSSNYRYMAVRVLTYVGLLYQDLIRAPRGRAAEQLPAILPIVLHSGRKAWSAPTEVSALLVGAPRGLERYRPQFHYLLIDQAQYEDVELASRRNLAALLFRIEHCRRRDVMQELLSTLREWLEGPEVEDLRRAFVVWLTNVVFKRLPAEQGRIANNSWEKSAMLSDVIEEWERELRQDGWQKGRQEGVHELMGRLLRKRFGELPEPVHARLRNASLEQLESWTEHLLDAKSLDEVFGCVQPTRADS